MVLVILLSLCGCNALYFVAECTYLVVVNEQMTWSPSCKLTRTTIDHVMIVQIMDQVDKVHETPCWINVKVCSLFFNE